MSDGAADHRRGCREDTVTDYERILGGYDSTSGDCQDVSELLETAGFGALKPDTPAKELEQVLRKLVQSVNGADALRCEAIRRAATEKLADAGIIRAAGLVNAAFHARAREHADEDLQGRGLRLHNPELWPDSVNGDQLLRDLAAVFSRFVSLPPGGAETLALWTLHAYALPAARTSPILALTSPDKRCGKSTALTVLYALVPRALFASNISPAALFRTVEAHRPTLLIDEADTFLRGNDELRGLLNSGHVPTGTVVRTVGDDYEPRAFSTWCAKALAHIGELPGTLADRAIVLPFRRRKPHEKLDHLRLDRLSELEPLGQRAARWARDSGNALLRAEPEMPSELNDRAADNWRPLLAIADLAGGPWPALARHAARTISGPQAEAQSTSVMLVDDLRQMFAEAGTDRLSSRHLVETLAQRDDRPWSEMRGGHPITVRRIAKMLQPFGVHPRTVRSGGETFKGYCLEDFADVFDRYLPPNPSQASQPNESAPDGDPDTRHNAGAVTDPELFGNRPANSVVTDVTDRTSEP
jgi:hypothetical protein